MAEKDSLDPSFTHAMQLLQAGTAVPGGVGRAPCRSASGREARLAGGQAPGGFKVAGASPDWPRVPAREKHAASPS
ncbi:KH RNA binding domain containing signal transduction associated 1 KHDRBS1 transcript variant X2 mRNA [Crotalus adamanteus]|uniref:KH RNA binding domain containing signal transduction associated 1 KHDRBS1 transcript variant X2 mRNA n=1 Tax=Crotalus adamanteus TaxID=8729 RepID=A0AAW1B5V7_CROAD